MDVPNQIKVARSQSKWEEDTVQTADRVRVSAGRVPATLAGTETVASFRRPEPYQKI